MFLYVFKFSNTCHQSSKQCSLASEMFLDFFQFLYKSLPSRCSFRVQRIRNVWENPFLEFPREHVKKSAKLSFQMPGIWIEFKQQLVQYVRAPILSR